MRKPNPVAISGQEDARQGRVLEAALGAFLRYGFRKTSMEEVARAAQLSRQGLYLHFPTKEDLFRAALKHALDTGFAAATNALLDDAELEPRLVAAIDAWVGRFVGLDAACVADLYEASATLGGPLLAEYEAAFVAALSKALRGAGLVAAYKSASVNARQLAETLNATVRGLKHSVTSREEFMEQLTVAVRVFCAPLKVGS